MNIVNMLNECEQDVQRKMEQDIKRPNIEEVGPVEYYLRLMDPTITDACIRNLNKVYFDSESSLKDLHVKPRSYQLGAAFALYTSLSTGRNSELHIQKGKHDAALLTMPPASGKSYVIAILCAMVC